MLQHRTWFCRHSGRGGWRADGGTCPAVLCEPMCTPTPHNPVTSAGAPSFWEDTVSPWPVEVMIKKNGKDSYCKLIFSSFVDLIY